MRRHVIGPGLLAVALLAPCATFAGASAAKSCAAALPAEAKAIYDASAPEFASTNDPRALVKAKVLALIAANKVKISSARASGYAAGECLKKLR